MKIFFNLIYYCLVIVCITSCFSKIDNKVEESEYLINTENYIEIIYKIDILENELMTARYFLNKQRINNQQFNNLGFDPFNIDFIEETSENGLVKERAYYKVYYKDNKIVKYESYAKLPATGPSPLVIPFDNEFATYVPPIYTYNEINLTSQSFRWGHTNYYIYNDINQFVRIIRNNNIHVTEIFINYIFDDSAVYKTIIDNVVVDEGKLFLNEDKKIIRHRSTFIRSVN